ncbi:MAG: SUMF1/EgtB/PvdO family nonheme iron enzyme [Acidobacteria bacterium]|nr:SUMF1/EgtB/PvdO family nonheme iron enzyme [Acidobacteriota bacterium]
MSEGRRYAILIGSGRFDNEPKLTPLKCPERDVDGMREIMAATELGAFGETFVFKDAENHTVLRRIEEVLADATGDDQVLVYYSGHGETDLPGRLYLATTNTEVRRLVSTSIPVETLRLFIENSACRKIILILDCCYGGAVGKSFSRGSVDEKLKELARGSGVYILTASTASQTAQEREGDDYGLLTKHIISGIKQGAADVNDDGFVSMDDLYSYVFAKVKGEGYQEPMRWALNVKGADLIIARASGTPGREKQRLLNEKVIEFREFLPRQIFLKALQVIDERRAPFYDLMDELYRQRLQIGEFIEEWYRIESAERQQPPAPPPSQLRPQTEEPAKTEVVERQPQTEMSPPKPQPHSQPKEQLRPQLTPTKITGLSKSKSLTADSPESITDRLLRGKFKLIGGLVALIALVALFGWLALNKPSSPQTTKPSISNPETTTSQLSPDPGLALRRSGFETVTLDAQGKETSRRTLQAEYFTENLGDGVTLEMVKIPAGEFQMGSTEDEAKEAFTNAKQYYKDRSWDWFKAELPRHRVEVSEFFMGRFEVTREQWRQVARMTKVKIDLKEAPSNFKDSWRQPVEQVSWDEAVEFCQRLRKKTSKDYRLPTEAEWEYAARAGTTTPFAFGPTITAQIINYDGNYPYGSAPKGVYRKKTVEVGSLAVANTFGLYDMHGNVWEWCEDVYHNSYGGQHGNPPTDGSAWNTGGEQDNRVLRGGSWYDFSYDCRSAYRDRYEAGSRYYNNGFRVVIAARTK